MINNDEIDKYVSSTLRIDIHEVEDVIRHQFKQANYIAAHTNALSIEFSSLGTLSTRDFVLARRIEKLSNFEDFYNKQPPSPTNTKKLNTATEEKEWLLTKQAKIEQKKK